MASAKYGKKLFLVLFLSWSRIFAIAQMSPTSLPNTAQPVVTPVATTPMSDLSGVLLSPSLQPGLGTIDLRTGGGFNRGETLGVASRPGLVVAPRRASKLPVPIPQRNEPSARSRLGVMERLERQFEERSAPNASVRERRARALVKENAANLLRGLRGVEEEISPGGLEIGEGRWAPHWDSRRGGARDGGGTLPGAPAARLRRLSDRDRGGLGQLLQRSGGTQNRQHQARGLARLEHQRYVPRRDGSPRTREPAEWVGEGGREALGKQALARVFEEDPQFSSALLDAIESSPYGSLLLRERGYTKEEVLVEKLSRCLQPYFKVKAKEYGYDSSEEFLSFLRTGSPEAVPIRRELRQVLLNKAARRAQAWTYLFRDRQSWEGPLRRYLGKLIARRAAASDKRIEIKSVGSNYGVEAYSLAIIVDQVLREMGENPVSWNVSIKTYDASPSSLLSSESGVYRPTIRDLRAFRLKGRAGRGVSPYFRRIGDGMYRLKRPLRDWISPVYADLSDAGQHSAVRGKADIVFAGYHGAAPLAQYWLSGEWSRHGFLRIGQTFAAEVVSQTGKNNTGGKPGYKVPLMRRIALVAGDGFRVWSNWLRNIWNKRLPGVRKALALGRSFGENLRANPLYSARLDSDILDSLLNFVRGRGVQVRLTTKPVAIYVNRKTHSIGINTGWLLRDGTSALRKKTLLRLVHNAIDSMDPVARLVPAPRKKRWVHPEWGNGEIVLYGTTREGAVLEVGRFPVADVVFSEG